MIVTEVLSNTGTVDVCETYDQQLFTEPEVNIHHLKRHRGESLFLYVPHRDQKFIYFRQWAEQWLEIKFLIHDFVSSAARW